MSRVRSEDAGSGQRAPGGSAARVSPDCAAGYSNPHRWAACSNEGYRVYTYTTSGGVTNLTGELFFAIRSSIDYEEAGSEAWVLEAEVTTSGGWGTLQNGAPGVVSTACRYSTLCDSLAYIGDNTEGTPVHFGATGSSTWYFSQHAPSVPVNGYFPVTGSLGLSLEVTTIGGSAFIDDNAYNTLRGRCDGYSNRYGAGCVNDTAAAFVYYSTIDNPLVGPVAQHVYDSIQTLPSAWGAPGSPLNRVTNATVINNNRNAACGGFTPNPGEECDEYPLAASSQGGTFAAPNDRSVRSVPGSANSSQGGITNAYFDYYRIIEADPFYVNAQLANGLTAW